MRILDEESGKPIKSILIMLTPVEAKELEDKFQSLNPEEGDHIHVNDENFIRNITVLVYTQENLRFYSQKVRDIIESKDE